MYAVRAKLRLVPVFSYSIKIAGGALLACLFSLGSASAQDSKSLAGETVLAKGTYVCSPSGFGQKSRCYRK